MTAATSTSPTRVHLQTPGSPEAGAPTTASPRSFHETIPGHAATPLVHLTDLAASLGVGDIMVKDEQSRLGLPSFKVLGGSWAVNRLVASIAGEPVLGRTWDDLLEWSERIAPRTLVTATDGNHGRGVARMAHLLGFSALVLVPNDMVAARIDAIASEGADVEVVDGDYDMAVARAAELGAQDDWHTVADVATEAGDEVPRWVMDGYATIFEEVMEQAPGPPSSLFIQAGVGALAGAATAYFEARHPDMRVAVVEPLSAACLLESSLSGGPLSLDNSQGSMMAGLNCGTPSSVAWPVLDRRVSAFIAIDDDVCGEAMRRLADVGIVAGESGAAALAGLMAVSTREDVRCALGLDSSSRVLVLNTEGATDPDNYEAVVGRTVSEVEASHPAR